MDQSNNKNSIEKKEWVPIYKKKLGEAINRAKGRQSMAEFARKCGLNPMTLSRAVNGTIKKPLDEETIRVMAECSDLPTEEILNHLMYANGWTKNNTEERHQLARQRAMEVRGRYEAAQNIIMRTLFEEGLTIAPVLNTDLRYLDHALSRSKYPLYTDVRFALSVQGHEPEFFNYSINTFTGSEFSDNKKQYKSELEDELFFLMKEKCKDVFLRDTWEPQAFDNSIYSIVLVNKDLFDSFVKTLDGVSFNNTFSIILIDLNKQKIIEEKILPRRDGVKIESIYYSKIEVTDNV